MAIFKCKMCGGTLEILNETVAECEFCGTQQTLPKGSDEAVNNLFNRANNLRIKGEFDKAEAMYEKILETDNTQAEAHWGIILCKYGIEYVEDPKTFKRVPTCHRASYESVVTTPEYLAAIEHSDISQRDLYEAEAKVIDEIQKGILDIARKEEPFDVFICYKESDETGARTQDSVIANDIYHQLTQDGLKVFYSAITLEDKLGREYEPYIFAALNSAKVMLVIGTKPEYFEAVWVKNEWSRFLKLMQKDRSRLLIPCYRNMDAYDLPEEFAHFQAQDMGKIGFINDVVRGIKKVSAKDEPAPVVIKKKTTTPSDANTAPLLKRAFLFLEDGDWNSANEYCEKVLDLDPECAEAYLGKLMAELKVKQRENLKDCAKPFDEHVDFKKVMRFANDALRTELDKVIDYIAVRNENNRLENIYTNAVSIMESATNKQQYENASNLFQSISGYQDSAEKIACCEQKIEEIKTAEEAKRLKKKRIIKRIKKNAIIATVIICIAIAVAFLLERVIIPAIKYNAATKAMNDGNVIMAYETFVEIKGYKDSAEKADSIYVEYMEEIIKSPEVGDFVFFGAYEQDNDTSNGKEDIEWIVLEVKDGKALLISKYALDYKTYNTSDTDATWENSTIRKWLNSVFIDFAFSDEEQLMIPTVTVSADKNPNSDVHPGNETQDKMFLLSSLEFIKYLRDKPESRCMATDYAVAMGLQPSYAIGGTIAYCDWWLRSPVEPSGRAHEVLLRLWGDCASTVGFDDITVGNGVRKAAGVRPAMWINLN